MATATTMTPEQLNAHRDEVVAYIASRYELSHWQKVRRSRPRPHVKWNDGVWLAWERHGYLVGLVGASDGYMPDGAECDPNIALELSEDQFTSLRAELMRATGCDGTGLVCN